MEPRPVVPSLYLLPFEIGQAYLYESPAGLVLVDTGIAGSGETIRTAIRDIGHAPEDLREVILTHYHDDHRGGLPEVLQWSDPTVVAHALDARYIRGELAQPEPDEMEDWERALADSVAGKVPVPPPGRVDLELMADMDLPSGLRAMHNPGHTPGSLAILIPGLSVMFTGDNVATVEGAPVFGPFNANRKQALASFHRLGTMEFDIACPGHGEPLVGDASARIRGVAATW